MTNVNHMKSNFVTNSKVYCKGIDMDAFFKFFMDRIDQLHIYNEPKWNKLEVIIIVSKKNIG